MSSHERPRYRIVFEGGRHACVTVHGYEGVSALYRFDLELADDESAVDWPSALGGEATLELFDDRSGVYRRWRGVVTDLSRDCLGGGHLTATIEPRLALLDRVVDTRTFLDQSVTDIVRGLLREHQLEAAFHLERALPVRAYTVAWRESVWAFICRLLEDEGVFYWIDEDGVLHAADSPSAWQPSEVVLHYGEALGTTAETSTLTNTSNSLELVPSHVLLRDFDFERPKLELRGECEVVPDPVLGPVSLPERVFYDYPGELLDEQSPDDKARRRAQAFAARASRFEGIVNAPQVFPGGVVSVADSPADLPEGSYVVMAIQHRLHVGGGFELSVVLRPASSPYRPAIRTPVPTVDGPSTAFVVGPEDIHTDAWGRVRLHFPWDRRRPGAEATTAWVPCVEDNTGHSMAIPRRGWELLVHFFEGDPDRPVILGRVYNGADPPPDTLPSSKTRSRIQSLVSPSRQGQNMIELCDSTGEETFRVYAQRDHTIKVANDRRVSVIKDESWMTKNDERLTVENDRRTQIGVKQSSAVTGNVTHAVGGERRLDADGDVSREVAGASTLTTPVHIRKVGCHDRSSGARLLETVGGIDLELSREKNLASSGGPTVHAVGGALIDSTSRSYGVECGGDLSIDVGLFSFDKAGHTIHVNAGTDRTANVGGALSVVAGDAVDVASGASFTLTALDGTWTFPDGVVFKVGETLLTAKDGKVVISGAKEVKLRISGKAHFDAPTVKQI
ncbi:MAG: type VI secretion system tip protein TssI/VgrG [Polyangiaceae bacterium]